MVFNYWILLFVFRRQNDTSLAERPKDTSIQGETHIEEAALRAPSTKGAAAFSGRPPLWIPLYGSLPGYGFVSLGRPASDVSFCQWVSPWV